MSTYAADDILIDALAFYLSTAGVTDADRTLIERAATDVARIIETVRQRRAGPAARPAAGIDGPPSGGSDYEAGWDGYSRRWERTVQAGDQQHLGDEWGVPGLTDEIVDRYVVPYLPPDAAVLEIGCGGGKYSERLAPLCRSLVCGDVSGEMLERARRRLGHLSHVRYEKLNGVDLESFAADSLDFVFSFDCCVHVDLEDVYGYLLEIRRVLSPRGAAVLHVANFNSPEGFAKFLREAPINRGHRKHFDRFRFLTWEMVQRLVAAAGLRIVDHRREPWRDILVVLDKRE